MISKLTLGSLAVLSSSSTSALAAAILTPFQNQTGPFYLRVTSVINETFDGSFLVACRTGNLNQGLCLGPDTVNNHTWYFFWNYTILNGKPSETGLLTWTLPSLSPTALGFSEAMSLNFQPGSNVALPMFMPGPGTPVGWDNDALYIPSRYDDTKFMPNIYPNSSVRESSRVHLKNWHACWVLWDAYYFNSVAWVSGGEPRNPTCEPVGLVKVDPEDAVLNFTTPLVGDAPHGDEHPGSEHPEEKPQEEEHHDEDEGNPDESHGDEHHEEDHHEEVVHGEYEDEDEDEDEETDEHQEEQPNGQQQPELEHQEKDHPEEDRQDDDHEE
ncbi:hypothetical protein QBC35DRAFT_553776 [Podospora australis]|uniref:DUF7907 domain-containing protein n=1 Tax=Podospora australis TaxID=1536484 RepID=A0AAN6X2N1_9PEZI|nr:hypothetical protein QBC35DRAFT_553776 [Podospora australis]